MASPREPSEIDLLLVDDDGEFRGLAARHFRRLGFRVGEAGSADEAVRLSQQRAYDVAVVDMIMPEMSGIELLRKLRSGGSECEVIMLTGEGTIESAVEAIKLGARDYLTKPVRLSDIEVAIHRAHEAGQLRKENQRLRAVLDRHRQPAEMIGQSPAMEKVYRLISRAGPTDKPILIEGESGTGKELVARALRDASQLADKPLVVINCAALPETMLESELFGHEKGAFTGAISAKQGLFELADGGTLLIDEIGEMSPALQVKLLRVLEDGSLRRVGSLKERRVKVRLLAATNRDIAAEVKAGRFREDLYYRINVMTLKLPPLRSREGDVKILVDRFCGNDWQVEPDAMDAMCDYSWPGNVRQLINAIERAKIMADDNIIVLDNLPPELCEHHESVSPSAEPTTGDHETDLASIKRAHILEVLRSENGNKARCAKSLGVSRRTLYRLLEKYDITVV